MATKLKKAAATVSKPRVLLDFLTALSLLLTIVSGWSYDLGAISMVIDPEWKPFMAKAGAIATVALQLLRPFLPSPSAPPVAKDSGA